MHILIFGAGVIGVTSAYQLYKKGYEVTIIDRNTGSAQECSFANGGQLSFSHAEPWANMRLIRNLPNFLLKKNAPIIFSKLNDSKILPWCLKFLSECKTTKSKENNLNILKATLHSKKCLDELDSEIDIDYARTNNGTIHIFDNKRKMDHSLRNAEFQKQNDCDYKELSSRKEVEFIEPAFKNSDMDIVGGIYFPIDGSGHVNKFTVALSRYLQETGKVNFLYNTNIEKIKTLNNEVISVKTDKGEFKADKYLSCLGASTPLLYRDLGIKLPIYPMKGYSISVDIENAKYAPNISVTDQCNKVVYSRLGNILRVAGTAEFASYNQNIRNDRINLLRKLANNLFPACADFQKTSNWACLRPQTPSGLPIIGKSDKYDNLYFNTGHGTLGWTMSFGSAKIIADIICRHCLTV